MDWVMNTEELLHADADTLIDCTFNERQLPYTNKPFLFHSPIYTLADIQAKGKAGRFCAWNTFLERDVWDVAIINNSDNTWVNMLMPMLNRSCVIVQDVPGLVAPRMVANIINEAMYALHAGISSRQEIDVAMKLGTNYPYGPFEWADKIGSHNVNNLLQRLAVDTQFYKPVAMSVV